MRQNTEPFGQASWASQDRDPAWSCAAPGTEVRDFHRRLAGYRPTPLVDLPDMANQLGLRRVLAKDESTRLGLPAFKALGASWAIHRVLEEHAGADPVTIVTATDGNHGRAVARFARLMGQHAHIFLPHGVHPTAVEDIAGEGPQITMIDGDYDQAVAAAAKAGDQPGHVLVQDTSWPGYEQIPGWIVDGYATLFLEIDTQLAEYHLDGPDLVLVPAGVGSLLQAALRHYRSKADPAHTAVVAVEPVHAACIQASIATGEPVTVQTGTTAMAGLNCGTPSTLAWPYIRSGLDAAVAVTDSQSAHSAGTLADLGVEAGPCGAAPLAALKTVAEAPESSPVCRRLGLRHASTAVLLVTEGATSDPVPTGPAEPESYRSGGVAST